jgi:hypothetical protein
VVESRRAALGLQEVVVDDVERDQACADQEQRILTPYGAAAAPQEASGIVRVVAAGHVGFADLRRALVHGCGHGHSFSSWSGPQGGHALEPGRSQLDATTLGTSLRAAEGAAHRTPVSCPP